MNPQQKPDEGFFSIRINCKETFDRLESRIHRMEILLYFAIGLGVLNIGVGWYG